MYLLDTHTLIWFLSGDEKLSQTALEAICSEEAVYISAISLWEIAIKKSLGKLVFNQTIQDVVNLCKKQDIEILEIEPGELDVLINLPFIHRDPFDRLLVATAIYKGLKIISKDSNVCKYQTEVIW